MDSKTITAVSLGSRTAYRVGPLTFASFAAAARALAFSERHSLDLLDAEFLARAHRSVAAETHS